MKRPIHQFSMLCLMLLMALTGQAATTASWDFKNDIPAGIQANTNYQNTTADIESSVNGIFMHVDATNGKLYCVGRDNAQFNAGTILQVPVSSNKDVVTVEGYPGYSKYHYGNETEVKENTTTHTATNAEVKQGYVEIISDGGYLYCVSVELNKSLTPSADVTGTWDFGDATVMEQTMAFSGTTEEGTVEAVEKNGLLMTVAANGAQFRSNGNNIQVREGAVFKIPVKSTNDVVTVNGYPGYSSYTIGSSTEALTGDNTYTAKNSDVKQGYVAVTSASSNNYYYKISVVQKAIEEKPVLENFAATATFPFNLGTEGQTADFGDAADYYLSSKVTYGNGLTLKDKNSGAGFDQTRFEPKDQNNSPDETNYINFLIQPKFGLSFTPTKVALKTTRFGTDNGLLDIAWLNADGTTVTLATEVKPNRNNGAPAYSDLSYEVTGATPGEGLCGLQIHLYHLQSGKQIGFADIVITGLLNGQEVEVPMLDVFTANGVQYIADDVFAGFDGTIELSKKVEMVSATNPITDVKALSGEIGEITYSGDATKCDVTIPVSLDAISVEYVVHFVQKPDFTLTYFDTDGSKMGTQAVEKDAAIGEFAIDYNTAKAVEGYKVRGWFAKGEYGQKITVDDIVTGDLNLYAVDTEIEEASTYKKYNFDLTNKYFYPEDHEAFVPVGKGYWHDTQHGWAFTGGDRIELLVGPKATISIANCKYGKAGSELVFKDAEGNEIARVPAVTEGDGEINAVLYEGNPGKIYVDVESTGEIYIHSVRIVNTAEVNFASQGNWYFVKPGDANSLIEVIDYVNGVNASKSAERSYIFLPDGVYDLHKTVLTTTSGNNVSIIGQSREKTIVKNAPDRSIEGIGTTAVLINTGQNFYMQDITLQNALDYYGAQSAGQAGGRAVCLQDRGDRAIMKNVAMLSYQDTYYSQNTKQAYWEDCDVHGTVDFLCGGGDVRFVNTTLSLEPRNLNGTGGRTICAPTTTTNFGYVFDNCKVVDLANGKGDWNFGRTWQNQPIAVYLNTTLDDNAAKTLVGSRWTQKGMNSRDPKVFGEYGTKNEAGEDITPSSNIITSYGGKFETILTAEQAEGYTYDKMFTDWDPASLTIQSKAPEATYSGGKVSWKAVDGAIAYAIFKNDVFAGLAEAGATTYDIEASAGDVITIRSANSMGGFGEAAIVEIPQELILDENAQNEIPAEGTVITVKTKRTLVGGVWNTFCVPFAITAEEMAAESHPLHNATIMTLSGATYDEATNAQDIAFTKAESMEAGKPYVIKVDADVVDPTFSEVTIGAEEAGEIIADNCKMVGLYSPYEFTSADENIFFISGGTKFSYVGEPGTMKGLRAYFVLNGMDEGALQNMSVEFGEVVGIRYIGESSLETGKIYDLQGRELNRQPRHGVYIMNGKKYVK